MAIASPGSHPARETVGSDWLIDQRTLDLVPRHVPNTEARITWAHSIELDDPTPYLRGGELVLTTGLRLARGAVDQAAYVDRLVSSEVAGLGFGTGLGHQAVPAAVVRACVDRDLLLVEVPLRTPFMAVAQAVADRLGELRRLRLIDTLDAQRALTRRALSGGVEAVVRTLARQIRAGVYVADRAQREVARAGAASGLPHRLALELAAGRRGTFSESGPQGWFELQLLGERRSAGLGWLTLARPEQLSVAERLVLTHAVSLVALLLDRVGRSWQPAAENALVQALLDGDVRHVGPLIGMETRVSVVVVRGDPLEIGPAIEEVRAWHRGAMLAMAGEETVLLVRADQAVSVAQRLVSIAGADVRAGIGHAVSLVECRRSLATARSACATSSAGQVVEAEEMPPLGFLQRAEVREAVTAATAEPFRMLRDADTDGELFESLRVYLDHHGNWDRAARQLGVHRHTLRNRMRRVEDLTGLSLDQSQDRLALHVGLLVAT